MKKMFVMAAAMGFAVASFAAVDDALLTFATQGPDKYADGTTVLDGEFYALVWTANGAEFAGFKADGTLVAATDKLIYCAPLAENGACKSTLFQIPSKTAAALEGKGTYSVYLLDSRVKAADGTVALAKRGAAKVPVLVNGSEAVGEKTADIATVGLPTTMKLAASAVGGATVSTESVVDVPTITGIKIEGAKVTMKVSGMSPIATYKVVTGAKPGQISEKIDATVKGDTFEFAKPEGGFFKVIGTRNFK